MLINIKQDFTFAAPKQNLIVMPNKIYLILFFLLHLSLYSIGQVTIWSEDFESYNDNFSQNGADNNLPSGSDWTRIVSYSNYFRVESDQPIAGNRSYRSSDASAYWQSETIDISSFTDISASVDYYEYGNLENADFINIEYRLNGGTWMPFTNGFHQNDMSGAETASISGLNGSNIQIRIRVKSNKSSEFWLFDNIEIQGITTNPPDCNWRLCLTDSYGDGWTGGSIKINVGGNAIGSYTLNSSMGPYCIDIPIAEGDDIELDYSAGNWPDENAFFLFDAHGNLVYSSGDNGSIPTDYTYFSADCDPLPVDPNEQDCLGAISICGDSYSTTNSYEGSGNVVFEINGGSSCLRTGERNDVWYIFTVQEDGDLLFTITPNNPSDDYDWAIYDLTNSSCSDIATDPSIEVSCNYSQTDGDTGPDGTTNLSSQGSNGSPFNDGIPVLTGEVYVINVSNFSSTQDGYTINFTMASDVIIDVTPPELQTIVDSPTCGEDDITAWFTELVDTSSVNASNFIVTGPGGPYSITDVLGTSNSQNEREFKLSLDAQLTAGGSYSLVFSGQVNDACGNTVIGNSLNFTVAGLSGSATVDDGSVLCYNDDVGSITASATNGSGTYFYAWNTGSTSNTITDLAAETYTVTINDDVGVCQDIITATVNSSNPYSATGVWAGTKNSNWYDCENWGGGRIPNSSHDVIIPNSCTYYPIFSTNTTISNSICQSLRIQNGGSISITNGKNLILSNISLRVDNGGTLNVNGKLTINSGATLLVSGGTISTGGIFENLANTTMFNGQINTNSDFKNNSNFNLINGSISVSNEFKNTGTFSISGGSIDLEENFKNNDSFISTGGEVIFSGNSIQQINGVNPSTFSDLTINNSSGVILLVNNNIYGDLALTNGDLNISDKEINFGNTGTLVNENASNRIVTLDGGGFPIEGGTLKATRTNPSGNIAGLGLIINPSSPLGNTVITRGPDISQGTGTFTGNSSVSRYFIIESDQRASITTNVTMSYFDSDLLSHLDGTLIMFQEVEYGSGPAYLKPLSTTNDANANTAIATTVNNNLSNIKLTLGSSAKPLPVSLIDFTINCVGEGVLLEWQTASEVNNAYFNIEKSEDGIHYEEIDEIEGHGNSNELLSYQSIDRLVTAEKTYYRLKQTDFDGTFKYIGTKVLNCSIKEIKSSTINLHPNPVKKGNPIYVTIEALNEETEVEISIINILSQSVFEGSILTDYRGQLILKSSISKALAKGNYIINGTYDNKSFQKKLIIN